MNTLTNLKSFNNKTVFITERIFKILFFVYAALSYCSVTYGHPVISFFMWSTALFGAVVLLQRLILYKEYIKMPVLLPCIAFTLCLCMSILANISYDLKPNIILLGYFIFYFFIIFTHNQTTTLDKVKKDMYFFSYLFIIYTTIAVLASFVVMFTGFNNVRYVNADNFEIIIGFKFGRLWGLFLGPNGGAVFALVSIAMMLCCIFRSKKFLVRFLLSINIIIHMLYITFSDSRTALVCILVAPICAALLYAAISDNKKRFRFVKSTVVSVLTTILCFTFVYSSKYAYNNITMIINESNTQSESTSTTPAISDVSQAPSETPSTQEPTDNTPSPDINPTEKPAITFAPIDRDYNLEDDYSNRRFDLWKSGLEVYKDSTKNMLVGTTYYGMRLYSYENLPDTYLVNNSQTDFANFHNEFINILVAQGALGFISIVWMILSIIIYVIKNFKKLNSSNSFEFITAAVIVIILALASMFIPGVFYLFAPSSIVFWMFLGYAVMLLKKGNEQEN